MNNLKEKFIFVVLIIFINASFHLLILWWRQVQLPAVEPHPKGTISVILSGSDVSENHRRITVALAAKNKPIGCSSK
jgi:hypothetical protein